MPILLIKSDFGEFLGVRFYRERTFWFRRGVVAGRSSVLGCFLRFLRIGSGGLRCWRRNGRELGEFSQVLGGGGEHELVLRALWSTQAKAAELEDALEVGEQHLDLLSFAPGLLVVRRGMDRPGDVSCVLVDVARDLAMRRLGAASLFKRAWVAVGLLGAIEPCPAIMHAARGSQLFAPGADIKPVLGVPGEVGARQRAVTAP